MGRAGGIDKVEGGRMMIDINDDLRKWNDAIADGEALAAQIRARVIRQKGGLVRRLLLKLLRFTEAWVARGKRWRDDDIGGE